MINFLKKSWQEGTQIGKGNILTAVYLGGGAHLSLYFVYKYWFGLYENIYLRVITLFFCISVGCYYKLSDKIKKSYFPFYWHLMLILALPFMLSVNLFKNNFNEAWLYWEIFMIFLLALYVPNWLIFTIDLIIGVGGAFLFYLTTTPIFDLTPHFNIFAYLIVLVFSGIAGLGFVYGNRFVWLDKQHLQHIHLTSLAGSIVHEIRNPLNTINLAQNQVNELLQDKDNDNKAKLISLNSSICDSIKQANEIINIVLSDLKDKPIEASDFSYLSTDKILPEIINTFGYSNLKEKEKVKLDIKDNFIFKAVDDRFTFIIYNLLKNALYYLNEYPNSIVTLGVKTINPSLRKVKNDEAIQNGDTDTSELPQHFMPCNDGDRIDYSKYNIIYVHDTGPGIPSSIIPKLFGNFFTSGKKDGTGLGLSFCKRNMLAFGGDIICESELAKENNNGERNSWTKFSLLFPKLSEEEIIKAQTEPQKRKILLVDDQQVNLLTTKSRIEQNLDNIICDITIDSKEAIDLAKENKYHLILMDIQMPKMNGIATTKEIRKFNKDIPIIAYTSLDHDLEEVKYITNDLLKKPAADNILFRTISKWITDYKDEFSYLGNTEEYKAILKDKNILLADDQEMNLMMTKISLELSGLKVTIAKDGKELLEIYKNNLDQNNHSNFDLILTDINMPPYNGDDATKEIRKTNRTIPIIALSGDGNKKDINHFFACEINDYFIKGSDVELLIKIMANYLIAKKDESNNSKQINDQNVSNDNFQTFNSFSNLEILDYTIIQSLDQNSRKIILTIFFRDSQNLLAKIMASKTNNNTQELFFHVHALKGIVGNIGAKKLFEYVKEINSDLKNNKLPNNQNWFEQLELMHKELVEEISGLA